MSTETSENGKKITDLKSFFEYFKRAKFMGEFAKLSPTDAGINYRCVEDQPNDKTTPLTSADKIAIAQGLANVIKELVYLRAGLLIQAAEENVN